MKKQLVFIGILALLVSVGLSGCSSNSNNTSQNNTNNIPPTNPSDNEKNKFVGTWSRQYGPNTVLTATFFSDGTMTASSAYIDFYYGSNWELKDGMLTINLAGTVVRAYNYVFSNNDKTLTLTLAGQTSSIIYTKQ